ncbi:hypothetical protein QH494_03880 [Sphingomonas sp. AR_OL41]|uniref:hypothetical protein n=1 Tax=Sphingomonas sp. AR_OL41 TaxID=3042729 RepID=UPI0024809688|nr:hypothetical protein [Sphingomonas sp. AR_OL41]MDH7971310.1 hypothetical protein [Sphingomonas sp. AR_OL41]
MPQLTRLHGTDIPETVSGTVTLIHSDQTKESDPVLVVEIVGDDEIYGPLVCFSAFTQATLRSAASNGRGVNVSVSRPRSDDRMPVAVSVNVVAD